jgi:hypothetical protein
MHEPPIDLPDDTLGRGAAVRAAGWVGQSDPTRSLGLETLPALCQRVHQDRAAAVLLWSPRRAGLLTARTRALVWGDLSERERLWHIQVSGLGASMRRCLQANNTCAGRLLHPFQHAPGLWLSPGDTVTCPT